LLAPLLFGGAVLIVGEIVGRTKVPSLICCARLGTRTGPWSFPKELAFSDVLFCAIRLKEIAKSRMNKFSCVFIF